MPRDRPPEPHHRAPLREGTLTGVTAILCCVPVLWISCYYAVNRKPSTRAKLSGLLILGVAVVMSYR